MEMERERERESEQFQISYQQKVRELQKAQETVCYLQEQLDAAQTTPPAAQTTPPPSVSVAELRRAEEEMRRSEMKMQESLAKNAALEKEVGELRGKVDTLYSKIADLAQDNYTKMADKEDEWEEEKEKLLTEIKGLEDEVSRLTSQISCLQAKLNQAQQQQRQPGPYELAEAAAKLRDLQKDNASLKAQVKAHMTYQPSQSSAGAICCDSAGTVTSAAVYHLRGELAKTREEKEKLMARAKKLLAAVKERDELHDLDQLVACCCTIVILAFACICKQNCLVCLQDGDREI
jgi:hypothetical protein